MTAYLVITVLMLGFVAVFFVHHIIKRRKLDADKAAKAKRDQA
jgi:hypothetical protein